MEFSVGRTNFTSPHFEHSLRRLLLRMLEVCAGVCLGQRGASAVRACPVFTVPSSRHQSPVGPSGSNLWNSSRMTRAQVRHHRRVLPAFCTPDLSKVSHPAWIGLGCLRLSVQSIGRDAVFRTLTVVPRYGRAT